MAKPGFWDDSEKAQGMTGELSRLKGNIVPLQELSTGADDLGVLLEFAEEDASSEQEIASLIPQLQTKYDQVELQATMAAPECACDAFLQVQAGEGGTDSADWADMLLRMYGRWAENRGFKIELVEHSPAEEAGIRNATIAIKGDYAYGYLRGETGNHRLIRISPFDSAGRRQTSFAAVDVTPDAGDTFEVDIQWDDKSVIREDTYRASGAGGQHVNKTDSAIRLTHLPTGEVVQCQSQRSQHKNRAQAQKMLIARLFQIEQNKRDAEQAARRGSKSKIGFGGETIRNYVLHPDQFVKDTRTGFKVGNPQPILDGGLDPFLESFLKWTLSED